jgi:ribulose-phosphate 3-epimerase
LATVIDLAPSILSANFAQLGADAKAALDGGGTVLHLDVMDGHFVPNLTIGPPVVASLRKTIPDVTFDCHLMIENADEFIPAFAEAGANWISVHQEACVHLDRTLHLIDSHGCKPGVVINPATPVHMLDEVLEIVHHAGHVRESRLRRAAFHSQFAQKSGNPRADPRVPRPGIPHRD